MVWFLLMHWPLTNWPGESLLHTAFVRFVGLQATRDLGLAKKEFTFSCPNMYIYIYTWLHIYIYIYMYVLFLQEVIMYHSLVVWFCDFFPEWIYLREHIYVHTRIYRKTLFYQPNIPKYGRFLYMSSKTISGIVIVIVLIIIIMNQTLAFGWVPGRATFGSLPRQMDESPSGWLCHISCLEMVCPTNQGDCI